MKIIFAAAFTFLAAAAAPSHAQDTSICGPPPSEDVLKDLSTQTKGDIEGKAQAISRLVGQANLGGTIESERRAIYQTSDKSEAIRLDRYLAYVTCLLVVKDTSTSLKDKLELIQRFRSPVDSPPKKESAVRTFLSTVERDTPLERVTELIGSPDTRKKFSIKVRGKKREYILSRYNRDGARIYLIYDKRIRGVAVSIRDRPPDGVTFPIANFPADDNDKSELGTIKLGLLRDQCDSKLSRPDARWLYTIGGICFFGNAGHASFFIFGFDAWVALEPCGDPLAVNHIAGKPLSGIGCPATYETHPNFVLSHFEDETDDGGSTAIDIALAILHDIYWGSLE